MDTKKRKNYTFVVKKNGRKVQRLQTHEYRRFYKELRQIIWEKGQIKVYLRVNYGKHKDNFGKMSEFYNDGWYETKEDLWLALKNFKDEEVE